MISSTYYEHLYAAHIVDKCMKYVNMMITIPKELKERMRKVENAVCITADERTQYSKLRERYPIVLLKDVAFFK